MGLAQWFDTFNKNLRMSDADISSVQHRYKQITKRINKDYWGSESDIQHSLYVGSYGRGTAIHLSDIDMLVVLPAATYHRFNGYTYNKQSSLLQEVKKSLDKTYSSSIKKGDGQIVSIKFTDGISFEIVPAFLNQDGCSFTYPDTNGGGSWKVTYPREEITAINKVNNETNKNLKRLCRMMRAWKDTWNVDMKGFLIDTLAYNFIQSWEHKNDSYLYYDWMTRDFFEYLIKQSNTSYYYAPGSNSRVYITGNFSYKAKQCYNLTLEAINYEEKNPYTAMVKWRQIFGYRFPKN